MYWRSSFIITLLCLLMLSCKDRIPKEVQNESLKMEQNFPFSESEKIEIISFPVRYEPIVFEKKLIDSIGIKERFFLNEHQKNDLFNSLFLNENEECTVAACFDPRHAILFYNDKSEIIAHIVICFDCGNTTESEGLNCNRLCYEGLGSILKIFKKAGIKYFSE